MNKLLNLLLTQILITLNIELTEFLSPVSRPIVEHLNVNQLIDIVAVYIFEFVTFLIWWTIYRPLSNESTQFWI